MALAAIAVVGATLAYFTDVPDEKVNTFEFGKVDIELDETSEADEEKGYIAGDENEEGNGFDYSNILPGLTYAKEPVITIQEGSLDAYVFAELIVEDYHKLYAVLDEAGFGVTDLSSLLVNSDLGTVGYIDNWMEDDNDFHIVVAKQMSYDSEDDANNAWKLFEAITIPEDLTSEILYDEETGESKLGGVTFTIKAYAVQQEGIENFVDAWAVVDPYTEPDA